MRRDAHPGPHPPPAAHRTAHWRTVGVPAAAAVAQSVGFYYMSNACGRLIGTIGSGLLYTYAGPDALGGLAACFVAGTVSSLLAALITLRIRDDAAGLHCGRCVCIAAAAKGTTTNAGASARSAAPTSTSTSDSTAGPAGAEAVVLKRDADVV